MISTLYNTVGDQIIKTTKRLFWGLFFCIVLIDKGLWEGIFFIFFENRVV